MRAIRQHELGAPDVLRLETVPDPEPGEDEVVVSVEAAGVHLVDTVIRRGEFWQPTVLPMTPGREVAGRVVGVGEGSDSAWIGRRVVAHLGEAGGGGYAEQAVVSVASLHEVPSVLTSAIAVAAIGTGRTATGVLDVTPIGADDVVVVTAASGGLGALLVREARRQGAFVVGLAGGPEKADAVRRLGASAVVDQRVDDWQARLVDALGGRGPSRVYDGVGGEVADALYGALVPDGVLTTYSGADVVATGSAEVRAVLGPALTARAGGLRSLESEALDRAADGSRVPLVGDPYALADAPAAHRALDERRTIGKVVLVP